MRKKEAAINKVNGGCHCGNISFVIEMPNDSEVEHFLMQINKPCFFHWRHYDFKNP